MPPRGKGLGSSSGTVRSNHTLTAIRIPFSSFRAISISFLRGVGLGPTPLILLIFLPVVPVPFLALLALPRLPGLTGLLVGEAAQLLSGGLNTFSQPAQI